MGVNVSYTGPDGVTRQGEFGPGWTDPSSMFSFGSPMRGALTREIERIVHENARTGISTRDSQNGKTHLDNFDFNDYDKHRDGGVVGHSNNISAEEDGSAKTYTKGGGGWRIPLSRTVAQAVDAGDGTFVVSIYNFFREEIISGEGRVMGLTSETKKLVCAFKTGGGGTLNDLKYSNTTHKLTYKDASGVDVVVFEAVPHESPDEILRDV